MNLNLNFEFESAREFFKNLKMNFVFLKSMNLNFVFLKSMNLILNFIFSKPMNLNLNFVFSKPMNLNSKNGKIMNGANPNFSFFCFFFVLLLL